ncbi:alpha/beta hydrolase [Terrimonas sp.]|uniref:alpha/beta hydrolase n=1 Tax=Terrimonas sp. TaxID=1914338 RepID=UPI000D519764|nr:alpha/beta hydrolase [Terrimonas sp.]PVD52241.1 alpha/beta hydrolase [Terrimonas sp.]
MGKQLLSLVMGFLVLNFSQAQVNKLTYTYTIKNADTLQLDMYANAENGNVKSPCLLFLFGGAFVGGQRNDSNYHQYFYVLAHHGIKVIAIDYRLGLKGVTNLSVFNTTPLKHAINMAVDDLFDATNWILKHSDSVGIDTSKIILSGSSSGAITVLQSEYMKINEQQESKKLPPQFQYAGVIAFSGAILSYKGKPAYKVKPAPTLFFHGTADKIVPYKSIRLFNKGMFGSSSIADTYKKENYSYYIYRAEGLGHEVSVIPMITQIPLILNFIDHYIVKKQPLQTDMLVNDPNEKPMLTISANVLFKKLAGK